MPSDKSDGAVVTGAASGIGRAIAAGLAADGFSVVIADLDEVNGRAAAEEIAASNQGEGDLPARRRDGPDIGQCRHRDMYTPLRLDQGDGQQRRLQQAGAVTRGERGHLAQNHGCERAWRDDRRPGSRQGDDCRRDQRPYCASKFAVVALTHAGARALAGKGITVNAFAPGVVATPLWQQLDKDLMAMGQFGARRGDGEFLQLDPAWSCRAARRRGRHGQVPGVAGIRLHDRSGPDDRRRNDSAMGRGLASEGMKRSSPASRHPSRLACARSSG
jgi:meso-butanediol dehydrogenase / (S,S)-butanediol dehydrogenase / diacetyl reductase